MPDFWTHLIIANEVAAKIKDDPLKKLIEANSQLFNFAAQGADFFFYHNFLPWEDNEFSFQIGEEIHHLNSDKLFAEILTTYKKENYSQQKIRDSAYLDSNLIYLLGFISHFALDSKCHPYIINHGGAGEKHKLIEASIDLYLMQKKWNKSPVNIDPLPYYQLKSEFRESLEFFYQLIFKKLLKKKLPPDLVWNSYLDLRRYHRLFFVHNKRKYYFLKALNYLISKDLSQYSYALCEEKEVWPQENYQKFEKFLQEGAELAAVLITKTMLYFESEISLSQLLKFYGSRNFLGENKAN